MLKKNLCLVINITNIFRRVITINSESLQYFSIFNMCENKVEELGLNVKDSPDVDSQGLTSCALNHVPDHLDVSSSSTEDRNVTVKSQKRKLDDLNLKTEELWKTNKKPTPRRPGFGDTKFDEADYYFEKGLRKVYPYRYTYTTFCKGRWIGKPLLKVFAEEFRAHSKEAYEACVKSGQLTVNDEKVETDYILKDNDLIANRVHRHELPVLAAPIKILHHSKELLVIDKPPSVPVHPCGRYRSNTIVFILGKEHGFKDIHVLHRLDRLTSGVLMFGLEKSRTRDIEEQIRTRAVSKEYLCRVQGLFPDGTVECEEPIRSVSFKIGVCMVDPNGKPCKTQFEKISYNGKSSVVLCRPTTGRMHQIRVHLQYLGFPIINDPIYNHPVFGPLRGKNGQFDKTREQLVQEFMAVHTAENWLGCKHDAIEPDDHEIALKSLKHYTESNEFLTLSSKYCFKEEKMIFDQNCPDCKHKFRDPKASDLVMFLHAWKYKGEGFNFESSIPVWAQEDWQYS